SSSSNPCTVPAGTSALDLAANPSGVLSRVGGTTLNTLTNPRPTEWPDFFIAPNVINPKYFSPMGRALLALIPMPNNKTNPAAGSAWNANDAQDNLPLHVRKNFVFRTDTVLSQKTRFSVRALFDRDDSTTFNRVAPGIGSVDNPFPGNLLTGT